MGLRMRIFRTIPEIRRALEPARARATIGLVPTMGALHAGHVALLRAARGQCDQVVASLFVNPAQFDDPADLAAYPRDEAGDAAIASASAVDYLFAPSADEMSPSGSATVVDVQGPALGLEGDLRPGHFRAVATVCLKLFTIVGPDQAFFGQKDAQQVAVIRQLVRDLHLALRLQVVPTVRDRDGLALSSRNSRLSRAARTRALAIPRALEAGAAAYQAGRDPAGAARAALAGLELDYVEIAMLGGHRTLAIAARVEGTRLIDNVPLDAPELAGLAPTPAAALPAGGGRR